MSENRMSLPKFVADFIGNYERAKQLYFWSNLNSVNPPIKGSDKVAKWLLSGTWDEVKEKEYIVASYIMFGTDAVQIIDTKISEYTVLFKPTNQYLHKIGNKVEFVTVTGNNLDSDFKFSQDELKKLMPNALTDTNYYELVEVVSDEEE